jgi:glyoxylase-like metal-dependent hydrolase (beta-lactamase superfamily II)
VFGRKEKRKSTMLVKRRVAGSNTGKSAWNPKERLMFKQALMTLLLVFGATAASFAAAPLPDAAKGVPISPDKGYYVREIADGLYWVTEGVYETMFLTTGKGVIVVDAPPSFGDKLLKAIAEVTNEPIAYVIYSHSHADHIAGAGRYPPSATYIAHEDTKARLERMSDPSRAAPYGVFVGGGAVPMPTVTFADSYTLTVGNQTLELSYRGDDHEPGNIYVYAPKQKVLLKIDIVFPGWTPFINLAVAEDAMGYLKAQDVILSYDFDWLVSGHFGRLATRKDVEVQKAYMQDIVTNSVSALKSTDFMAIAAQTGFENLSLLFDTYLKAVAQRCAELTIPKWIDRLGGVDVWTGSHCFKVVEALRID